MILALREQSEHLVFLKNMHYSGKYIVLSKYSYFDLIHIYTLQCTKSILPWQY